MRGTEGFISSLIDLMKLPLACPDYSTLSRRWEKVVVGITRSQTTSSRHIVIDSTGIKVYGEGEWKVRQHGYSKRRTWRKLHLGVDESTEALESGGMRQ
ncbi:MAG: transposase [Nitrospirae bacterium]|nr:transposase [Magnetococcales bacterium]